MIRTMLSYTMVFLSTRVEDVGHMPFLLGLVVLTNQMAVGHLKKSGRIFKSLNEIPGFERMMECAKDLAENSVGQTEHDLNTGFS